jgi:FkbM family methyltransferase
MAFVTYAQNWEDVVLHRALSGVVRGHYIDVGANHPSFDSVTRAFYDRGWRGINVEPIESMAKLLELERPEDVTLRALVGERSGKRAFYEIADGSGLSTVVQQHAEELCRSHGVTCRTQELDVLTLDEIIEGSTFAEFHFLKIDVEGAEASVIRGIDLTLRRPWIIVVEAHEPLSQTQSHACWEGEITGRGYSMVYCDGLNRFYLADEHADLRGRFAYPPNIFDEVIPYQLVQIRAHQDEMIRQLQADLERVGVEFPVPAGAGNAPEHFRDIHAWSAQAATVLSQLVQSLAHERSRRSAIDKQRHDKDASRQAEWGVRRAQRSHRRSDAKRWWRAILGRMPPGRGRKPVG